MIRPSATETASRSAAASGVVGLGPGLVCVGRRNHQPCQSIRTKLRHASFGGRVSLTDCGISERPFTNGLAGDGGGAAGAAEAGGLGGVPQGGRGGASAPGAGAAGAGGVAEDSTGAGAP